MAVSVRAAGLLICRRLAPSHPWEFLLLQTSYGIHHWTPPKGHVDPGENEEEAAERETKEEAGICKSDYEIFDNFKSVLQYSAHGKPKTVTYWLAKLKNYDTVVKLSEEHQDLAWLPVEEACKRAEYPEMQKVLSRANTFLEETVH